MSGPLERAFDVLVYAAAGAAALYLLGAAAFVVWAFRRGAKP